MINVHYYDPIISGGGWRGDLTPLLSDYSHESSADYGYKSIELSFGSHRQVSDWALYGLGRHIKVFSNMEQIHEGFVNVVEISAGSYSQTIGPLVDVSNRVVAEYTAIDPVADPPASGPPEETVAAEDVDSQNLYGIWDGIVDAGEIYEGGSMAEQIRDTFLGDRAYPPNSKRGVLNRSILPTITLHIRGYKDWLSAYIYNSGTTGTSTITTKLQSVLAADPNNIFSTSYDNMETNNALVATTERDNRFASEIVGKLTASGDGTNYYRWIFMVLDDRTIYHQAIPQEIAYEHRIQDPARRITTITGEIVRPETVLPGRWLFIPDYLTGQVPIDTELNEDPRCLFLESVKFTAPNGIEVNGTKLENLPQLLAQRGLGGMA